MTIGHIGNYVPLVWLTIIFYYYNIVSMTKIAFVLWNYTTIHIELPTRSFKKKFLIANTNIIASKRHEPKLINRLIVIIFNHFNVLFEILSTFVAQIFI